MNNSEKNVRMFVCGCLFYEKKKKSFDTSAKLMLFNIFLLTCINMSTCCRLFPIVDLRYVFTFLSKRWTRLERSVKEVSSQITISESTNSGREKLIFSWFSQKQLQIHDGTENRLNALSQRLLPGIIKGTNKILRKN